MYTFLYTEIFIRTTKFKLHFFIRTTSFFNYNSSQLMNNRQLQSIGIDSLSTHVQIRPRPNAPALPQLERGTHSKNHHPVRDGGQCQSHPGYAPRYLQLPAVDHLFRFLVREEIVGKVTLHDDHGNERRAEDEHEPAEQFEQLLLLHAMFDFRFLRVRDLPYAEIRCHPQTDDCYEERHFEYQHDDMTPLHELD